MQRARPPLVLLAIVIVLAALGAITWIGPDVAWSPSYFDGQDEDLALWMLSEEMPGLVAAAVVVALTLRAGATAALPRPRARALLAPARSRPRSPPPR